MIAKQEASLFNERLGRDEVSAMIKRQILSPWEEAVGFFRELVSDGGGLLAEIGPLTVYLPLELEDELRPNVGKKIAILRTDDSARSYRIRQVCG